MFSPVRAPVDPKKWCIVVEPALEASKHNPNSDHCSKILRETVKFERNAIYRQHQRYSAVLLAEYGPILCIFEPRELCHYSAVYRCSSTIHNLENQTNSPGLGLSANFLFGKIVSYNVLKNG